MTAESRTPLQPESPRRFIPMVLLKPVLASALGIDGGALFQIIAVENLRLSPVVIGTAFGLGLLSLPIQLWAAREPLHRARRNLQLFLSIAAMQATILVGLLAIDATGGVAAVALVVAVTAEINISVLFVTAWQPLLSARLGSRNRQRLNSFWRAVASGLLAVVLVVFSVADKAGRMAVLVTLAGAAIAIATRLPHLPALRAPQSVATRRVPPSPRTPIPATVKWILTSIALLNLGALPLWLVYVSQILWPSANLGLIGSVQAIASVLALLGWRTTEGTLGRRALAGAAATLAGGLALTTIGGTVDTTLEGATVVAVTAVMAGGLAYASVALLEIVHRTVDHRASVRTFTILDVVDSSSLQLGLFIAGLLVAASNVKQVRTPYIMFVVAMNLVAIITVGLTTRLAARNHDI
jgi:hypothetical protein